MFCVQCGTKLADDAKFCMQCGAKVTTIAEPAAPVTESATAAVVEPAPAPVEEPVPVADSAPVVETVPVIEPIPQVEPAPAVETASVEPAAVVEPAPVEPAPAVEAVPVEPAPQMEAATVEPAPAVEPVVVGPAVEEVVVESVTEVIPEPVAEPAPAVGPEPVETTSVVEPVPVETTPVVESTPVETTAASASGAPADGTAAPSPAKKKPKVWLIVLLIVLGLLLICGCGGCGIGCIVVKKAGQNGLNNLLSSELSSDFDIDSLINQGNGEDESDDPFGNIDSVIVDGTDGAANVTTQEISNAFYEGTCKIESVSGADELIAYLEKVSGATMSDSEKETFRNPDITSTPNMQMQISSSSQTDANGTSYYDGEFGILLPYACGSFSPQYRSFSGWDMLTNDEISAGNYEDLITIQPVNGKFSLKRQVPDEGKVYAGNLLSGYANIIDGGDFGSELTGTFRDGKINGNYGIDGTYTIMLWYGDMEKPYEVKYSYSVDYVCSADEYSQMVTGGNNGYDSDDYDYDYDDFDFDDFDFDN